MTSASELEKVLNTYEHIISHDKGKLSEEMRELFLQTVKLLWELKDIHRAKAIDKLKRLLESQVEDPENWLKVAPVIEPSSEKDMESILHLVLQEQQVGFSFDMAGERFLGVYNWKG